MIKIKYVPMSGTRFTPDLKPEPTIKTKKIYTFKKEPTGEKSLFQQIWNERPHKSQIGGDKINEPKAINFMHVLPKGKNKYPEFKLLKQNIVLGTEKEHHQWDHERKSLEGKSEWLWLFSLEKALKIKYKLQHGNK